MPDAQELRSVSFTAGVPNGDPKSLEKLFNGQQDSVVLTGLLHFVPS